MKWAELLVSFFNVVYVVVTLIMIGFILVQRGPGAQAGASFGGGASATVFGARGSGDFLTRSTAVCAIIFFAISFGMGVYIAHGGRPNAQPTGFMSGYTADKPAPAATPAATEVPGAAAPVSAPAAPAGSTVPAGAVPVATPPSSAVAPGAEAPMVAVPATAAPAAAPATEVPSPQQ